MKSPVIGSLPTGPEMPMDNVQMLLARKAEIAKNRAKYTLTELDGNLLVTHATELHFVDGQTIVEGGHDVSAVYRIKSGKISIIRNGYACCELSQGWFIGDALFLYDKNSYRMSITMKAKGPVVLLQLDLNFVKQLFTLDITLAMKFYRLIATKNAAIFHQLVNTLHHTPAILCASVDSMPSIDTSSDTSSDTSEAAPIPSFSSNSSSSSICGSSQPASGPTPRAVQQLQAKTKRISRSLATEAYKVYPLVGGRHGVQTCRVKTKKIKIVSKSFGFQHKTSIEFSKLQNITKSGENAVTMLYDNSKKATTIFFKNYHDREEFIYLVSSLTTSTTAAPPAIPANQPISTPHIPTEADEDPQVTKNEEHFRQVQVRVELKKGERVFEEGDLYQRVYTLISGSLAVYQKGNLLHHLTEGQVFGVDTILFLRPCSVTIEVASETATLLIITSHKMNELIESDVEMAQRLFKRAAQILDTQITKVLHYEKQQQEKHHSISSSNSSSSISSSGSSSSSHSHSHSHGSLPHHSLPLQHSHSAPSVALSDSHGSSSSETEVN